MAIEQTAAFNGLFAMLRLFFACNIAELLLQHNVRHVIRAGKKEKLARRQKENKIEVRMNTYKEEMLFQEYMMILNL